MIDPGGTLVEVAAVSRVAPEFAPKIVGKKITKIYILMSIIIIYHDFLPTPRRGSHVKSDKTHTQSSRYPP